jgi:hypothetical protein
LYSAVGMAQKQSTVGGGDVEGFKMGLRYQPLCPTKGIPFVLIRIISQYQWLSGACSRRARHALIIVSAESGSPGVGAYRLHPVAGQYNSGTLCSVVFYEGDHMRVQRFCRWRPFL